MAERRRPPVGVVLAVAAVAAVAVIFFTRGLPGTEESDAGQILAVGSEQPDPGLLDGGWVRIDLPGTAQLRDVWGVGGTLYAAGRQPRTGAAVLWRSSEGRDWRQVFASDGSFTGSAINSMAVFGDAVLAFGTREVEGEIGETSLVVPAVWRSSTGEEFSLAADAVLAGDDSGSVGGGFSDVTIAEGRLVAVGWTGSSVTLDAEGAARGAIWISDDGLEFRPIARQEVFSTTGTIIREVSVDDESRLLAAGEAEGAAVIWASANGDDWVEVARGADSAEGGGWSANTLTGGPGGVYSYGVFRPEAADAPARPPLVWNQTGAVWAPTIEGIFDGAAPKDADADAVGYLVVGDIQIGNGDTSGGAWASRDGMTWSRVRIEDMIPGASSATGVAFFDPGVAVVGATYEQPAIWFRQAGNLDSEQPATAAGPLAPPAWATVFQEQTASGASPVSVFAVGGRLYGFAASRVIWTSDDGQEWAPALFDEVGLDDAEAITSIVNHDGVVVAIGENEGSGLWLSRDGNEWERPSGKLPCCVQALFAGSPGFTAVFSAGAKWNLATSRDGLEWEIGEVGMDFPVDDLWESASLGSTWFIWGSAAGSEDIRLWESVDGGAWVEAQGPDGGFGNVAWEGVWRFDDQIVAAGRLGEKTVVFETVDGLTWSPVALPDSEQAPGVRDAAPIPDGLALLLVFDGRLLGVSQVVGGDLLDVVPLSPEEGFGGLRAVLVPDTDALRAVGPDHGRMTVWEWIP